MLVISLDVSLDYTYLFRSYFFILTHISPYCRLLIVTAYFSSASLIVFNLRHTRAGYPVSGIGFLDLFSLPNMPNIDPSAIETSNSKMSSRNNAAVSPE